jgi:polysaccharide biosynthesis protein PslG
MDRRRFLHGAVLALPLSGLIAPTARAQSPLFARTGLAGHGFGIAIHDFSDATLDVAAQAGFSLIRTDFFWSDVESKRRIYDWSRYDALMAALVRRNLRPQFVLGFNNPDVYGGRWMEGITMSFEVNAYAAFCAAAADRYRDIDPIWEIYNEPNRDDFWEPKANVAEYMSLAKTAISAIRHVHPNAIIIAPALGHKMGEERPDLTFLEACLKDGMLPLVDAVSIHPYVDPEMVEDIYTQVRAMIAAYAGDGPGVPVVSTEWGFATNKFVSDDLQADVLVRMFLMNLSFNIPLSIAYVAVDRTEAYVPDEERTYGIVTGTYSPKAAFTQLQDLMRRLDGFTFDARLQSDPSDYVLSFRSGSRQLITAWTAGEAHAALIGAQNVWLTSRPAYLDG